MEYSASPYVATNQKIQRMRFFPSSDTSPSYEPRSRSIIYGVYDSMFHIINLYLRCLSKMVHQPARIFFVYNTLLLFQMLSIQTIKGWIPLKRLKNDTDEQVWTNHFCLLTPSRTTIFNKRRWRAMYKDVQIIFFKLIQNNTMSQNSS